MTLVDVPLVSGSVESCTWVVAIPVNTDCISEYISYTKWASYSIRGKYLNSPLSDMEETTGTSAAFPMGVFVWPTQWHNPSRRQHTVLAGGATRAFIACTKSIVMLFTGWRKTTVVRSWWDLDDKLDGFGSSSAENDGVLVFSITNIWREKTTYVVLYLILAH